MSGLRTSSRRSSPVSALMTRTCRSWTISRRVCQFKLQSRAARSSQRCAPCLMLKQRLPRTWFGRRSLVGRDGASRRACRFMGRGRVLLPVPARLGVHLGGCDGWRLEIMRGLAPSARQALSHGCSWLPGRLVPAVATCRVTGPGWSQGRDGGS